MKCMFFMLFFSVMSLYVDAQSKDEQAILASMDAQLKAWNSGDLEKFMELYWKNDSLMFIGRSRVTYGWQQTLNNYKKGYPDTASMGKLDFSIVEVKELSAVYYHVVGKWHLTRSAGDLEGYFTLLFKKINNKWLIIKDHSS